MEANEKVQEILSDAKKRMEKSVEDLAHALSQIRSGRATPALVEDIRVEVYGQTMPLNQVATINVPEARLITIDVWDKSNLQSVEKAIQKSGRDLNPQNDGTIIRIQMPELTEERRKELVKVAKQKVEDHKVAIRNIRRDANDKLKKLKNEGMSEDDLHHYTDEVQKLTDTYVGKMDAMFKRKEEEILTI
ncbi:MAG: ribosome recycling factor [Candidatus Hydrogenedentota bacterium]|nr:MAG: ribosome recycling factor [Candidatus Hydrogenedentota bacterium]